MTTATYRSTAEISRELSHHYPALHEELRVESARLRREVLLWQRWLRLAAAALAVLGGGAMMARDGNARLWAPLLLAAVAYALFTWLVGWFLRHGEASAVPPRLPALVLGVDVAAVGMMVWLSTGPANSYRILLLGFLVLQLAVFYFGSGYALGATAAIVALYLADALLVPPWIAGPRPTGIVVAFNVIDFLFVALALLMAFGSFRARLNRLRTFCRRVEVGDLGVRYDADEERPDDLTLLARSVDGMRHRLIELIGTDPLTGCLNRRAFEARLKREWRQARRRGSMLAVIAVDLDNFKPINDTYGHATGDVVLGDLAEIMRRTARDTDAIARVGGDEFVILLPDATWQGATTFAERLRRHVDDHEFVSDGTTLALTISVGVAVARGTDDVPAEYLLEEADRSLYKAKTGGRNRISA